MSLTAFQNMPSPEHFRKEGMPPGAGVIIIVTDVGGKEYFLFKEDFKGELKATAGGAVEKNESWLEAVVREANEELFSLLAPILKGKNKDIDPKQFPSLVKLDPSLKFYKDEGGDVQPLTLLPPVTKQDVENAENVLLNQVKNADEPQKSFAFANFIIRLPGRYTVEQLNKISKSMSYLGSLCTPLYKEFLEKLSGCLKIEQIEFKVPQLKLSHYQELKEKGNVSETTLSAYRYFLAISAFTEASKFQFVPKEHVASVIEIWEKDPTKNPQISAYPCAFFKHDCKPLHAYLNQNKITLSGKFILEESKPRLQEHGDTSYFLKLDFSDNELKTNEDLFKLILRKINEVKIKSLLFGEHDLKDYLTAVKNPVGEQKPHISIGWYGAFHQDGKPNNPHDGNIISRAKEIVAIQEKFTFKLDLDELIMISSCELDSSEVHGVDFKKSLGFLGNERDTILGWNLPEKMNAIILNKAQYIFGNKFSQTDKSGSAIPFHLTAAQGLLTPKLIKKPIIVKKEEKQNEMLVTPEDISLIDDKKRSLII